MTSDEAKQAIQTNFPDFEIHTIQFIGEGFDNAAFEVNSEYVFRFTKSAVPSAFGGSLEIEKRLLPELQKHISVTIPDFTFYGNRSNCLPFVGYKKINGRQLSADFLQTLSSNEIDTIFKTVTTFFNEIHSFPVSIAKEFGVQVTDFKKRYTQDSIDIKNLLLPLLNGTEKETIAAWIDSYLSNENNFTYTPSFIHADLWLSHILINQETKAVEGIIDFSDMTIGDTEYDYMHICQEYEQAYDYFEKYIQAFDRDTVKRKTEFFRRWNVVQDLLFFINRNDEEKIAKTLMVLKALL